MAEHLRLGDLAHVVHGWPFRSEHFIDGSAESVPVVVAIGDFDYSGGFRTIRSSIKGYGADFPEQYILSPGEILLVMTCQTEGGEILGVPARVPDDGRTYLHNQRIGRLIVDEPGLLSRDFAYHYARTQEFNRQLVVTATGSKILHTSPTRIEDVRIWLPCLGEQIAIAEVLGALDDKIAANTKLASTALDLADTAFREVSKGVEVGGLTYADVAAVAGGGTPRSTVTEFWDGEIRWLTPTDVTGLPGPYVSDTARKITEAGLAASASSLYPAGSIFMTSRATIGAFAIGQKPMATNQGFIVVRPHDERLTYWFYHEMRSRVDEYLSYANGATFLELSRGNFKKLGVRLADEQTMIRFCETAAPLHGRARAALDENSQLAATRDALLPQLMSGKLGVRDAERIVSEVA